MGDFEKTFGANADFEQIVRSYNSDYLQEEENKRNQEEDIFRYELHFKIWSWVPHDKTDYKSMLNVCKRLTHDFGIKCKLSREPYSCKYSPHYITSKGDEFFVHIDESVVNGLVELYQLQCFLNDRAIARISDIESTSPHFIKYYEKCFGRLPRNHKEKVAKRDYDEWVDYRHNFVPGESIMITFSDTFMENVSWYQEEILGIDDF